MAAITIATVAGNISVMSALRRARRLPTHYPLASLATADLLVGTCVLPLAAARELFVFSLSWPLCACWSTLDVLCCTASILSLCALGWERWCGITAPLARAQRAKRARLLAALVWPVAFMVALPAAFVPSPKHYYDGEEQMACTININVGYVFFSTSFSFYIPATVMVIFYARILRALSSRPPIRAHQGRGNTPVSNGTRLEVQERVTSQGSLSSTPVQKRVTIAQKIKVFLSPKGNHLDVPKDLSQLPQPTPQPTCSSLPPSVRPPESPGGIASRQMRATRTIIMLMSLFLICWTPFFIMLPIDSLCECVGDATFQWCTWLGYVNSALDPLVYAAASPSVRRALHATLSLTRSSTRPTDVPMTPLPRRN